MDEHRGTILVVDDEESIRRIISHKLQTEGFNCLHACSGEEALEKLAWQDFDLVLMDIKMPGMSGIDTLPLMTFDHPDICVVMSTAVTDTQTAVEAMNLGAYDYVTKPFDLDDMTLKVEKALERKRLEIEYRDYRVQAEGYYSALVENIADVVFKFQHNVIAWCNDRIEEVLGYTKDELIGKDAGILLPDDIDVSQVKREVGFAMREKGRLCGTTTMKKKDGGLVDIEYSASRIPEKEPVEIVAVLRDVTERNRAQVQLQAAEEKYRTIFENSAVAITVTDQNEDIVSWNKFAEALLGMDGDDLYMKPVSALYPAAEWRKIRKQNIRQKGMQHRLETKIIRKDNKVVDVDISVSVLKDPEGQVTGSIGVIGDISELKKMREEHKKLLGMLHKSKEQQ